MYKNEDFITLTTYTNELTQLNKVLTIKVKMGVRIEELRPLYKEIRDIHTQLRIVHDRMKKSIPY